MTRCYRMLAFESPIGEVSVSESDGYMISIGMGTTGQYEFQQALLRWGYTPQVGKTTVLRTAQKQLTEYFSGRRRFICLPVELCGTDFQAAVWQVVFGILYGETLTYGEVARAVGHPRAARAVGQAMACNRLPILIPCHRVVAADGGLGGFGCGLDVKQFLLQLEREHAATAPWY